MERARQNQESYDRLADVYLEHNSDRSQLQPWMQSFVQRVTAGGVVIDLGAGACQDSASLRARGLRVVSVDRSKRMLTSAIERFPGPRVQADLRHLPFRKASIDGVWACASLLHVDREELIPTLAQLARVLVPTGVLFMMVKDGVGERCESVRYGLEVPRWFTYWTRHELDAALATAGFDVLEAASWAGRSDVWHGRIACLAPTSALDAKVL